MNFLKNDNLTGETREADGLQETPSSFASGLQQHARACLNFVARKILAINKHASPIGLDIGNHSIKMIQVAVVEGRLIIVAAEKVAFDPDIADDPEKRRRFIIAAIKKMVSKARFKGRNVVGCLACDDLKITSLRHDFSKSDDINEVLQKEATKHFGFEANAEQIKYFVAGNVIHGDEVKSELIMLTAESEDINNNIAIIEEAGLTPVAVDTVPCALFRCFTRMLRRQEDNRVVNLFVDIGRKYTTLVISRGRDITFVKQIRIGGEMFDQEIAMKMGITDNEAAKLRYRLKQNNDIDEQGEMNVATRQAMVDAMSPVIDQLVREISLCMRYYTVTFRGERLKKAILTGGEVYENTLINAMKRQLTMDVEIAEPLAGFDMRDTNFDAGQGKLFSEWAVAVGLCFKEWTLPGDKEDDIERN